MLGNKSKRVGQEEEQERQCCWVSFSWVSARPKGKAVWEQILEGHRRRPYTTLGRKADPAHSSPAECFWLCADCVMQCRVGYCHKATVEDKALWNGGNSFFVESRAQGGEKMFAGHIFFISSDHVLLS